MIRKKSQPAPRSLGQTLATVVSLGALALIGGAHWLGAGKPSDDPAARAPLASRMAWSHAANGAGIVPHSVAGMQRQFTLAGYHLDDIRQGVTAVPRLYVARLPLDMPGLDDADQRKAVFIKALLPLILAVDEAAAVDRSRLIVLAAREQRGEPLRAVERDWLAALARRYGGRVDNPADLLARVDIVPPSLALAQAAEETGWGTSRVVLQHNALFGQQVWNANGREASIRAFDHLGTSVAAYIQNLNAHPAYAAFRASRAALRAAGQPLDSDLLARTLHRYSERRADYIADLRRIIRSNSLVEFDRARLSLRSAESS